MSVSVGSVFDPLKHSGNLHTPSALNSQKSGFLPTEYINGFLMVLRIHSNYFHKQHEPVDQILSTRHTLYLLRGRYCILKYIYISCVLRKCETLKVAM
jgi:hypothetical protein